MSMQLTLGIKLRDDATFDNFYGGGNEAVITALQQFLTHPQEQFIYLWGRSGVGCSHLLEACCHQLHANHKPVVYLQMDDKNLAPAVLQDLETLDLVCIDNIEAVLGNPQWEEALFHLYNRIRDSQSRLLIAATQPPARLSSQLPDLKSRLAWGLCFQVKGLNEQQLICALQLRAAHRGLSLPQEVATYLMRHFPRNMASLFEIFEKLDHASLAEQRRLTIPFVKKTLDL